MLLKRDWINKYDCCLYSTDEHDYIRNDLLPNNPTKTSTTRTYDYNIFVTSSSYVRRKQ